MFPKPVLIKSQTTKRRWPYRFNKWAVKFYPLRSKRLDRFFPSLHLGFVRKLIIFIMTSASSSSITGPCSGPGFLVLNFPLFHFVKYVHQWEIIILRMKFSQKRSFSLESCKWCSFRKKTQPEKVVEFFLDINVNCHRLCRAKTLAEGLETLQETFWHGHY